MIGLVIFLVVVGGVILAMAYSLPPRPRRKRR